MLDLELAFVGQPELWAYLAELDAQGAAIEASRVESPQMWRESYDQLLCLEALHKEAARYCRHESGKPDWRCTKCRWSQPLF